MQQSGHQLKANVSMQQGGSKAAPLDICYRHDGQGFFSGCTDGKAYWVDFNSLGASGSSFGGANKAGGGNIQVCGSHQAPIRSVHWIESNSLLLTSSMDSTIKFWDLRTSLNNQNASPVNTITLPDRVFSMDVQHPVCVICTANRGLYVYDLSNLSYPQLQPVKSVKGDQAPLNRQYRCVKVSPDKTFYAVTSIEGRVSVQYVSPTNQSKTFAYKCHRDKANKLAYPINDIAFHPKYNTYATIGGDGKYNLWDKDNKVRLEEGKQVTISTSNGSQPYSLTAGAFSCNGDKFAYAAGYDWSMGISGRNALGNNAKACILIKMNCEDVARPKTK